MTHNELVHDLADAKSTIYRELPLGSVVSGIYSGNGTKIADVVSVRHSYTRFCVDIYECKVSRADFLHDVRDKKYEYYLPHCHRFYYAVESGIATPEDVPKEAGLLVRGVNGWKTVRQALAREIEIPGETLLSMIFFRGRLVLNERRRKNITVWYNNTVQREELKKIGKRIGNALLFTENSIKCPRCEWIPLWSPENAHDIIVCVESYKCKEAIRQDVTKPHYHYKCEDCELWSIIILSNYQ